MAPKIDLPQLRAALSELAPWLAEEHNGQAGLAAPARSTLATAVRGSARLLAHDAPGNSVELRIPPFVAVQAIAGPVHTRGTPPNIVETDPRTWLQLATGIIAWEDALDAGTLSASGQRAGEIARLLPVFPVAGLQ